MTNRDKYRFDDFTLSNYDRLLDIALKNGYTFSDYAFSHLAEDNTSRVIVWNIAWALGTLGYFIIRVLFD